MKKKDLKKGYQHTGSHNINLALHDPIHDAVVGVHALVIALQALPAFVSGNAQRDSVFGTEFLEFGC